MESYTTAKREYVGVCAGSHSVGRSRKRWIDTMKGRLRKRGLYVRQARRMVQDRSEWWGFLRGNAWGSSLEDEPLTLMRYQLQKALEG